MARGQEELHEQQQPLKGKLATACVQKGGRWTLAGAGGRLALPTAAYKIQTRDVAIACAYNIFT